MGRLALLLLCLFGLGEGAMAHEVLVMKDGDVIESGSVEQVLGAPHHEYTRVLVAAAG